MKMVIAFVIGVVVGAVAALILAPKSGEELRQEFRQEAAAEREKLKNEYAQTVSHVQQRVDKIHSDVQDALTQAREKGETAVTEEQPPAAA